MPAYRLPSLFARPPLRRRLTGFVAALAVNLALLLVLMSLGIVPAPQLQRSHSLTIDLLPESRRAASTQPHKTLIQKPRVAARRPVIKPPRIILPVKPSIAPPPTPTDKPWLEMSKQELAAGDISNLPAAGAGGAGDSEVVGHGPNGEALYNAEWARHPTSAELGGYLPRNAPDGYGLIACKTVAGDRVEDCIELEQDPPGSHLAAAVRQAAWQFRVRPPRKGGRALVGSWVRIRIDYYHAGSG